MFQFMLQALNLASDAAHKLLLLMLKPPCTLHDVSQLCHVNAVHLVHLNNLKPFLKQASHCQDQPLPELLDLCCQQENRCAW